MGSDTRRGTRLNLKAWALIVIVVFLTIFTLIAYNAIQSLASSQATTTYIDPIQQHGGQPIT